MRPSPLPVWSEAPESAFTVVTLNLRFGLAQDGANRWARRRELWPQFLRLCPADFFLLQEVNDFQAEDLSTLMVDYACIGRRRPAPAFWQHNLIWYRSDWQLDTDAHFFLSPTPGLPSRFRASRWPRQCTAAVFRRADRRLAIAVTHLDFDPEVQAASARLIRRRINSLAPATATVVAGDFNAPPGTPAHRVLTACQGSADGEGPAFSDAFQPPYPGTHHGFTGSRDGDYIDWILYRGPIEIHARGVLQRPLSGRHLSDHYPVWAAFGWDDEKVSNEM